MYSGPTNSDLENEETERQKREQRAERRRLQREEEIRRQREYEQMELQIERCREQRERLQEAQRNQLQQQKYNEIQRLLKVKTQLLELITLPSLGEEDEYLLKQQINLTEAQIQKLLAEE